MNRYANAYRMNVASACPQCGKKTDGAAGGDHPPVAGDLSVCAYCATPLKFTDDIGNVARLEAEELAALSDSTRAEVLRLMDAVRAGRGLLRGLSSTDSA